MQDPVGSEENLNGPLMKFGQLVPDMRIPVCRRVVCAILQYSRGGEKQGHERLGQELAGIVGEAVIVPNAHGRQECLAEALGRVPPGHPHMVVTLGHPPGEIPDQTPDGGEAASCLTYATDAGRICWIGSETTFGEPR